MQSKETTTDSEDIRLDEPRLINIQLCDRYMQIRGDEVVMRGPGERRGMPRRFIIKKEERVIAIFPYDSVRGIWVSDEPKPVGLKAGEIE